MPRPATQRVGAGHIPGPGGGPGPAQGGGRGGQPGPVCPGRAPSSPICRETDSLPEVSREAAPPTPVGAGAAPARGRRQHPGAPRRPSQTRWMGFRGQGPPLHALIFRFNPKAPSGVQSEGSPELQTAKQKGDQPPVHPNLRAGPLRACRRPQGPELPLQWSQQREGPQEAGQLSKHCPEPRPPCPQGQGTGRPSGYMRP